MNIFVSGITSDIAHFICKKFLSKEGNTVIGTYRKKPDDAFTDEVLSKGGKLLQCDFEKEEDIDKLISYLKNADYAWDVFISAVGVMFPIEDFAETDIDRWEKNIYVNSISQFRLLKGVLSLRNENASVFFMTSKGINDAFLKHSAYCLSKIMLVKMCELLDNEIDNCKFIAFNPGFINTKIISQEGESFEGKEVHTKSALEIVWEFMKWAISEEKTVVSGRNFFVRYDKWNGNVLEGELKAEENLYKLRRCGDTWFMKNGEDL